MVQGRLTPSGQLLSLVSQIAGQVLKHAVETLSMFRTREEDVPAALWRMSDIENGNVGRERLSASDSHRIPTGALRSEHRLVVRPQHK